MCPRIVELTGFIARLNREHNGDGNPVTLNSPFYVLANGVDPNSSLPNVTIGGNHYNLVPASFLPNPTGVAGELGENAAISIAAIETCTRLYASSTGTRAQIFAGKIAFFPLQPLDAVIAYNPGATDALEKRQERASQGRRVGGRLPTKIFSLSPE